MEPERTQGPDCVGRQVHPRTRMRPGAAALDDVELDFAPEQRSGGCQARDPTAHDQDSLRIAHVPSWSIGASEASRPSRSAHPRDGTVRVKSSINAATRSGLPSWGTCPAGSTSRRASGIRSAAARA
jgi:hypothetical protein